MIAAFLSLIPVVLSLVWFQRRARALSAEGRSGREFVEFRCELENAYMRLCAFSLIWFWAGLYFRWHGSAAATLALQGTWIVAAYLIYRRTEKLFHRVGWKPEAVNWKRSLRFWGVIVAVFAVASPLSGAVNGAVVAWCIDRFGPAYFGSGASVLLPMVSFLLGMLVFVALSPWFIALAIPARRERDASVLQLVEEVFSRGGRKAPLVLRLDTGKNLFAAVAGLPFPGTVLFLSDSLVNSLGREELEAVVAHELTHVHEGHLRKRALWFLGLFVLFVCYSGTLAVEAGARLYALGLVSFQGGVFTVIAFTFLGLAGLFWALRKVVREQEAEADAYAVARFGADPKALVSALDKILAVSGRSRKRQPWISYVFPAAAHPTVEERERILFRAARRARFGIAPLRTRERAFVPYTRARRLGLAALGALCLWMLPMGFVRMHERELSQAFRHYAETGDIAAMRYFVERGADPRDPDAFLRAVSAGKVRAVTFLVEFGADPNWALPGGASAYELAWKKGHREVAAYLDRLAGTHRPEVRAWQSAARGLASEPPQQ